MSETPFGNADLDGSGFVDDVDLLIFHGQWHTSPPTPTPTQPGGDTTPTPTPTVVADQAPVVTIEMVGVSPRDQEELGITTSVSSSLNNVPLGAFCYFEGTAVDAEDGALTVSYQVASAPSGSTATVNTNNPEMASFLPLVEGEYVIEAVAVDSGANESKASLTLSVGTWVGISNCSLCHGPDQAPGSPQQDVVSKWEMTAHSDALARKLDGSAGSHFGESCLPCHTVGYDAAPTAVNNGWDDVATAAGWIYPATLQAGNWQDVVDNYPELANLGNIQCENCHGPGSLHNGDADGIDYSFSQEVCAACHDAAPHHTVVYQWTSGKHPIASSAAGGHVLGNPGCVKCHTAEGFAAFTKGESLSGLSDDNAVTCAACHNPHEHLGESQLRLYEEGMLASGQTLTDVGKSAACIECHNSRVDSVSDTLASSFRGAHHGPQADMLAGRNAANFDGTPYSKEGVLGFHATAGLYCVDCHMDEPLNDANDVPVVGGHSFLMRSEGPDGLLFSGDDITNTTHSCLDAGCHTLGQFPSENSFDKKSFINSGDYDGDGIQEGAQSELRGLLALLRGALEAEEPSLEYDEHELRLGIDSDVWATKDMTFRAALYNFNFVSEDKSFGIHNYPYAVQVLQRSYYFLTGSSVPDADLLDNVVAPPRTPTPTPTEEPEPTVTPTPMVNQAPSVDIEIESVSEHDIAEDPALTTIASGLWNVGAGQIVYLTAQVTDPEGDPTTETWSVASAPAGATATVASVSGQIQFIPYISGEYVVKLVSEDDQGNSSSDEQMILAGTWMGISNCAYCHGGANAAKLGIDDKVAEWELTGHATFLEENLEGRGSSHYGPSCLPCHTVGYDELPSADNGGWDDVAAATGWIFPATLEEGVWDALEANYPQLANLGNIQCENCHGPGSNHFGARDGIQATFDEGVCAACHDAPPHHSIVYQWSSGKHADAAEAAGGHASESSSCLRCHTAEGYAAFAEGDTISEVEDKSGITCAACHDPHSDENEHQLRITGDASIASGETLTGIGPGATCVNCHNSRVEDASDTVASSFRGAHHGPQADMILGVNAADFGIGEYTQGGEGPHATAVADLCVQCHMAAAVTDDTGKPIVGGHSFVMRDAGVDGTPFTADDITNATNACVTCHTDLTGVGDYDRKPAADLLRASDYDGNGVQEGAQSEVRGLMALLRTELETAEPSLEWDDVERRLSIASDVWETKDLTFKTALYNFNFVSEDKSMGVHNYGYTVQVLQRSYNQLTGNPVPNADILDTPATAATPEVHSEILGVTIPVDNHPVVEVSLTDGNGDPFDPASLRRFRFYLARIEEPDLANHRTYYESYLTGSSGVPTYDQGGDVTDLGGGLYTYRFVNEVTISNPALTHTVAVQIQYRDDAGESIVNPLFNFRPDGNDVTTTRNIATTAACNQCHDPLTVHGSRREVGLCVLCHQEGVVDSDNGNSINLGPMVHKIHMGEALPTVEDGTPYVVGGHDYSHVVFPQDHRNCTTCHQGSDSDYYKLAPSRQACGSCHDNIDFENGVGHIQMTSDAACSACHPSDMTSEFDRSVPGAHTIPTKSAQLPGFNAEVLDIVGAAPGATPTITFKLYQDDMTPVAFADVDRLRIIVAGPTTDYQMTWRETVSSPVSSVTGTYSYSLVDPIPADAVGTWAFAIETRIVNTIKDADNADMNVTYVANNVVGYAAVTGTLLARRTVVDQAKCEGCHDRLELHGGSRNAVEYCVMCHNPMTSDEEVRPATYMPPVTVDFRTMIHKIHMGENLPSVEAGTPYIIYGHNSSLHDYSNVLYPGNLSNCDKCHMDGTYFPPAADTASDVVVTEEGVEVSRTGPETAACTSCHDSDAAVLHASNAGTLGGEEGCAVCHGQYQSAAVDLVHELH